MPSCRGRMRLGSRYRNSGAAVSVLPLVAGHGVNNWAHVGKGVRTRAAGHNVVYTPRATVLHDNRARQGQECSGMLGALLLFWFYRLM